MKGVFFLLVWLAGTALFASPVDSLENELKTAKGEQKVKIFNELFKAYITNDPIKAVAFAHQAMDLANEINDKKGAAAAYNNIGVAYRNQGALDMALEHYMKSLSLYTELNNGEGVATTKNNIANIYSIKKDYNQALKYFEDSYNGFITLGNNERIVGSMNNLGNLHTELQMYDVALKYYSEAWKIAEKSEKPLADPLINVGNLFYHQGNYQRAVEYYQRALELVKSQGDRASELAILTSLGETYTKAGQPREAERYLEEAVELSELLQSSFYLPQILKSQAKNYARQGKMKDAYETMIVYDEAREKIYGEESSRRIAQMDVAMDLKAKEDEIEALQQDDKVKTLQLRNTQFIITVVVLVIVLGFAMGNLFMSRKK